MAKKSLQEQQHDNKPKITVVMGRAGRQNSNNKPKTKGTSEQVGVR
jgi:hypothetical protein